MKNRLLIIFGMIAACVLIHFMVEFKPYSHGTIQPEEPQVESDSITLLLDSAGVKVWGGKLKPMDTMQLDSTTTDGSYYSRYKSK